MCIVGWKKIGVEIRGIKTIIVVLSFLTIIGAGLFYWYEWRPNQIRKECTKKIADIATERKNLSLTEYSFLLDICLMNKGIEK